MDNYNTSTTENREFLFRTTNGSIYTVKHDISGAWILDGGERSELRNIVIEDPFFTLRKKGFPEFLRAGEHFFFSILDVSQNPPHLRGRSGQTSRIESFLTKTMVRTSRQCEQKKESPFRLKTVKHTYDVQPIPGSRNWRILAGDDFISYSIEIENPYVTNRKLGNGDRPEGWNSMSFYVTNISENPPHMRGQLRETPHIEELEVLELDVERKAHEKQEDFEK